MMSNCLQHICRRFRTLVLCLALPVSACAGKAPPAPPTPPASRPTPAAAKTAPAKTAPAKAETAKTETATKDVTTAASGPQTPDEQVIVLDRRLERSLGEFDGILLKEKELLAQQREGGGAAGAAASGQAGGEGQDGDGSEPGGDGSASDAADADPAAAPAEPGSDADAESGDRPRASAAERRAGGAGGASGSSAPAGTPDGRDDDIVARQLREAAEKETDPQLRAKLWEEYRRYKTGSPAPSAEPAP